MHEWLFCGYENSVTLFCLLTNYTTTRVNEVKQKLLFGRKNKGDEKVIKMRFWSKYEICCVFEWKCPHVRLVSIVCTSIESFVSAVCNF